MKTHYILTAITGIVFLLTGISKILDFQLFELQIYSLPHISYFGAIIISRLIVIIEISVALFLIFNSHVKIVALAGFIAILSSLVLLLINSETGYIYFISLITNAKGITLLIYLILLIILAFVFFLNKKKDSENKGIYSLISLLLSIISSLIFLFISSSAQIGQAINKNNIEKFKIENTQIYDSIFSFYGINEPNKIVLCLVNDCKYCEMKLKEINIIAEKGEIQHEFHFLILADSLSFQKFNADENKLGIPANRLFVDHFVELTSGKVPTVIIRKNKNYYRFIGKDFNKYVVNAYFCPL